MTITTLPSRNEYTANAGQTIFNYTFKIFESTDLNVYVIPAGTTGNDSTDLTVDYSVTGLGDEDGGSITLNTATNINDLVTIVSNIPSSRTIDYQNNGDFRPETVNTDFDIVVSLTKKIEDFVNRGLLSQQAPQTIKPLLLPVPIPNKLLRWNGAGSGQENVDISELNPDFIFSDKFSLSFTTVLAAINDDTLLLNQKIIINEYSIGNGGRGAWEVVATSTVTPNLFNIRQSISLPLLSIKLVVGEVAIAAQFGLFDGTTKDSDGWDLALASSKLVLGSPGKTSIIDREVSIPQDTEIDLRRGKAIADPDLPITDNIFKISATHAKIQNGEIDGNKANLNGVGFTGVTGLAVLITDGGDGARVTNIHAHDCITSGIASVGISGPIDDNIFENCRAIDNNIGGMGAEAQINGQPITNFKILGGEASGNSLGGDIRIQGTTNFLITDFNIHEGNHGALVVGVGEAKNICSGTVAHSILGNGNVGLPSVGVDGLVGGSGPFAGQIGEVSVHFIDVDIVGPGGNSGILAKNEAVISGYDVRITGHQFSLATETDADVSIDRLFSKDSVSQAVTIDSKVQLTNMILENWGSGVSAVLTNANSSGSTYQGRFGAVSGETGKDGIAQAGSPTDIKLTIDSFTGSGFAKALVAGSISSTWEINNEGTINMVELESGISLPGSESSKYKLFVDVADKQVKIVNESGQLLHLDNLGVTTTTALESVSNAINTTTLKREGTTAWNTTTNKPVWSNGADNGSQWLDATGAIVHTPI